MKGIESVMRGYADGGSVNPFQDYAGGPQSFNPFAALSYLSAQGRPDFAIRPPATIATPVAQTGGGYRDIYGNLEAIKAAQAAKKAAEAAAKVPPSGSEIPSAPPEGGGGGTGFSATPQGTPGSGFNVPGIALGGAGLLGGIPGLGALGTALGAAAANDYLSQLGLPQSVSTLEALKSGLSFGLMGQSPQAQVDAIIGAAIERGELDPDVVDFINEKLTGPTVAQQYGAQVATGQRSASGAFFDAINDMETVGRLSEVLAAIDRAEADRQTAGIDALAGEFTGPGGISQTAAPTFGGLSDLDISLGTASMAGPPTAPAPTVSEVASEVMSGTDAVAESSSAPSGDSPSAPEGFSGGTGEQDPGGGWARGGYVPGKSGGMDDDVPAIIDGKQPARLSSGEFVFDAATVAALGDGNNQAGAKKLNQLREAIRQKAYGHEKQPPKNYSVGDLVRMYDRRR